MATRKGTGVRKPKAAAGNGKKKSGRKLLSPRQKVRKSQEKVLHDMPAIVTNICGEAKKGSHLAAKFVFDFAGITELQSPLEEPPKQDSLAGILLQKLDKRDPQPKPEEKPPSTIE